MIDLTQVPRTPSGEELNEQYWQKIMPDVNKCGDRFLDLWTQYKHDPSHNNTKLRRCGEEMGILMSKYGSVVFAVNVVLFFENGAEVGPDVFSRNIQIFYNTMDNDLYMTVERLRFINTKFEERMKTISGQLRGRGIAFKEN